MSRWRLAARLVPGADRQQPGVLALRAGVGLQADAGVAGGLAQPGAQLFVEQRVAGELVGRRERVHVGELGPGDRDHLAGRVELHRARAQRDHAAVQRQVLVGQAADVAQHLGLAVVRVEHRVREELAAARQRQRDQRLHALLERHEVGHGLALGEQRPQRGDVVARGGLVERDAHAVARGAAQVHAGARARGSSGVGARAGVDAQRVEGGFGRDLGAELFQACGEHRGIARHAARDALQALGPVVDGVHAGHHGRQHLRGADVGGGLLAADVLLARLQRQAVGRCAVRVDADADQPAGHRALELVAAGQVGGVRAAVAHRHAEALRRADGDVGAHLARRHEQRQRQQVGGDDGQAAACVHGVDHWLQVAHRCR